MYFHTLGRAAEQDGCPDQPIRARRRHIHDIERADAA